MDGHSAYLRRRALSATLPLPRVLRLDPEWAVWALLVAVGYYFAARVGFAFTLQPHPISTLWSKLLGEAPMMLHVLRSSDDSDSRLSASRNSRFSCIAACDAT